MRRLLFIVVIGLGGLALLVSLGVWQLQRLAWKQEMLGRIEAGIGGDPVPLPDGQGEAYLAVTATGRVLPPVLTFVYSADEVMTAAAFDTGTRRIMVDLGLAPAGTMPDLPQGEITVAGNLERPEGNATPRTDGPNARPARDLDAMASVLDTDPVLLVARTTDPALPGIVPLPVTTAGIPNNHLGYALQWFGLALVWIAMSGYLARQTLRRKDG